MERECSRCGVKHTRARQRYCAPCHAAYMRDWRKAHPVTDEQRLKGRCRAYSRVLLLRGVIKRKPCRVCGSTNAQMHHPDYTDPRRVEWLCRDHHLDHHVPSRVEQPIAA